EGRVTVVRYDSLGRVVGRDRSFDSSRWQGGAPAVPIASINLAYDPQKGWLSGTTQAERVQASSHFATGVGAGGYLGQATTQKVVSNVATTVQTVDYSRDALGEVTQTILNGVTAAQVSQTWDGNGNLKTETPPGQPSHQQDYTSVGLLQKYTPPSASGIS